MSSSSARLGKSGLLTGSTSSQLSLMLAVGPSSLLALRSSSASKARRRAVKSSKARAAASTFSMWGVIRSRIDPRSSRCLARILPRPILATSGPSTAAAMPGVAVSRSSGDDVPNSFGRPCWNSKTSRSDGSTQHDLAPKSSASVTTCLASATFSSQKSYLIFNTRKRVSAVSNTCSVSSGTGSSIVSNLWSFSSCSMATSQSREASPSCMADSAQ
mmetsp:Transcript_5050/g.14037  ORF Transcript_5050/g.14037 Transcript_5050/m.14037 type:complete len:216 (+) Transcript_5050:7199-7846(+)